MTAKYTPVQQELNIWFASATSLLIELVEDTAKRLRVLYSISEPVPSLLNRVTMTKEALQDAKDFVDFTVPYRLQNSRNLVQMLLEKIEASEPQVNAEEAKDARLIAAAPELLDALFVCMEHNRLYLGDNHNTVIYAKAAIAKATGETP